MNKVKKQLSRANIMAKNLTQPFRLMAQDDWGNSLAVAFGNRADLEVIMAVTDPARNPEIVPNNPGK